jgi:hypothetical protein
MFTPPTFALRAGAEASAGRKLARGHPHIRAVRSVRGNTGPARWYGAAHRSEGECHLGTVSDPMTATSAILRVGAGRGFVVERAQEELQGRSQNFQSKNTNACRILAFMRQ